MAEKNLDSKEEEKLSKSPSIRFNTKLGEIAKAVIMPGDPLRARYFAQNLLKDYKVVGSFRGIDVFTGEFEGQRVSICASGMGHGSIGIYSYELFQNYDVDYIIRVGTCGSYKEEIKVGEVGLGLTAVGDNSSFAKLLIGEDTNTMEASSKINLEFRERAKNFSFGELKTFRVHSTDNFYCLTKTPQQLADETQADVVEMESYALFTTAKALKKQAATILTVSDNLISHQYWNQEERVKKLLEVGRFALSTAASLVSKKD